MGRKSRIKKEKRKVKKNHDLHECSGNQSYFSMIDEQLRKLTIERLFELEPGLWLLYVDAKNDRTRSTWKQTCAWFDHYKPALRSLIGWYKEPFDPILSSSEAWNLALPLNCKFKNQRLQVAGVREESN